MSAQITAVILTLNEEQNIQLCISFLTSWCKRIVVVDSGSSDSTLRLARSAGADVFSHQQEHQFLISEQRNWSLDNCNIDTEWVLFVDADEIFADRVQQAILTALSTCDAHIDAFNLTPIFYFWGQPLKRTMGYPNWHPRIIKMNSSQRFVGGVWEKFASEHTVGTIKEYYRHYYNSKGLSDWLSKHNRYSDAEAAIICKLQDSDAAELPLRKMRLRRFFSRFWLVRPIARLIHMYFLRLGFLEGRASLVVSLLTFAYELMIVIKVIELKRLRSGLSL